MKKIKLLLALFSFTLLSGCPSPSSPVEYYNTPSPSPYYPSPSVAPTSVPQSQKDLSSLRAGVLPDASLADAEKKLAGMLIRTTKPIFPLKIGVLLYNNDSNILNESDRRKNFDSFINKIKSNPNVGQVIEISSSLIARGAGIEEIRALGSRFQVSSVLVVSESYQYPQENNEAVITPIDQITGTRTWESFSNIEVYSIDILNGVMLFSTASGHKESDKYNRKSSTIKNPDINLIRLTANTAWKNLEDKVSNEISDYKKRLDENKVIPVSLDNKI
jgi:hypothetical protein